MDLSKLGQDELARLAKDVDRELSQRRRDNLKMAQRQARQLAESYGLSIENLIPGLVSEHAGSAGGVRFQHPTDAGKNWAGRGRKPAWIKEWEGAGKSLESLRVG
jgi:DNA-binding protein H-NS